jgi:hypothetical protein
MEKSSIQSNHRIVQAGNFFVSDMDGEKVMVGIHSGKYYNLGHIGGRIWEIVQVPTLLTDLISTLTAEYEISGQDCLEQVVPFLEEMNKEQLIVLSEDQTVVRSWE